MAVITVVSAKGSPGVSLAVWGLLHMWPRPIVGTELDDSGGTWAYRHGLTCEPGLASLAATQETLDLRRTSAHGCPVGESKTLVCAPKEGTIVRAAVGWLAERLLAWPETDDLMVDIGRVRPGDMKHSPALRRADVVVLVTGTRADELASSASVVTELAAAIRPTTQVQLLFVTSGPYSAEEAADALNGLVKRRLFRIAGTVPFDPKAAGELSDGGRRASKVLVRWYGPIAAELAAATAHRTCPIDNQQHDSSFEMNVKGAV
jgi:hypothetical protein